VGRSDDADRHGAAAAATPPPPLERVAGAELAEPATEPPPRAATPDDVSDTSEEPDDDELARPGLPGRSWVASVDARVRDAIGLSACGDCPPLERAEDPPRTAAPADSSDARDTARTLSELARARGDGAAGGAGEKADDGEPPGGGETTASCLAIGDEPPPAVSRCRAILTLPPRTGRAAR
jgi:hypothetical protein